MEKEIHRQYQKANKEISEKWNDYMERANKRLVKRENALSDALRSGDKELIAKEKKALEDAKKTILLSDRKYRNMMQETAQRIADRNQIAVDYINGKTPWIYAKNYNQVKRDARKYGIRFTTINENVVKRRITEGTISMRKCGFDEAKDVAWNGKKMNSAVLQGIIQGEDMNTIAKRLEGIIGTNEGSAVRNARTMVTQAENAGRLDSYKALEDAGAVMVKIWEATGDDRTRDAHLALHGTEVPIDEPFIDELNEEELMFPADPSADPCTTYNCRCTMKSRAISVNGKKIDYGS